jgi:type III pantothenate kinase
MQTLVDGIIERIRKEIGAPVRTIATGGMAEIIMQLTKNIDIVDPLLTLKGLKNIFEKNVRGST